MVSVCIASYNGEKFIKKQIDSILEQLKVNDEVIISDDKSTDNTIKIINNIKDNRIKLYINSNSSGRPTENFQNALEKAKGDYIFLADQDDVWLRNKCSKTLKLLVNNDLVLSNSIVVNENLEELNSSFFKLHGSAKGIIRNAIKNSYFGSCMAFKKSLLTFAMPFPSSREIGHDVWLGLVAEMIGTVQFINEPLILYRRHPSAVTTHGMGKSKRSTFVKVWGRVIILKEVVKFYIKYKLNWKKG